jgi:hypothetical protein
MSSKPNWFICRLPPAVTYVIQGTCMRWCLSAWGCPPSRPVHDALSKRRVPAINRSTSVQGSTPTRSQMVIQILQPAAPIIRLHEDA